MVGMLQIRMEIDYRRLTLKAILGILYKVVTKRENTMNLKKRLYIFAAIAMTLGVAYALTLTPQSITRQPTLNENAVLYAYEPTAGVFNAVFVDTNGNLNTTGSATISGGSLSVSNFPTPLPTATQTTTPVIVRITNRTFTSAQSQTPTPIATAVSGQYNHTQLFMNNTGTAGDTINIYYGSTVLPVYLAPAGGIYTKSFWDTASNVGVSISGGASAGSSINVWGTLDQQPYQLPINLPSQ